MKWTKAHLDEHPDTEENKKGIAFHTCCTVYSSAPDKKVNLYTPV